MLMVEPNAKMDDMYVLRLLDNTYLLVSNAQVLVIRKSLGYKLCISFWPFMAELMLKQYFSPKMILSLREAGSVFCSFVAFMYQNTCSVSLFSNILLNHSSLYISCRLTS
jgi:hypothetical protein